MSYYYDDFSQPRRRARRPGRRRRRRNPVAAAFVWALPVAVMVTIFVSALPGKPEKVQTPETQSSDSQPEHSPEERIPDTPASDSGTARPELPQLPEPVQRLYERCPEAEPFVSAWFDPPAPLAVDEIDLSELENSGTVPQLWQWDLRWAYASYAGNVFGLSGCGPTTLSMAAIYLTGDTELNPLYIASFAERNGYAVPGDGTAWTLFSEGTRSLGLSSKELPLAKGQIDNHLRDGDLVALIVGPGDFTDSGHFLLITGTAPDGGYTVNDPNSPENSSRTWTYGELEGQIKNLWALSAAD